MVVKNQVVLDHVGAAGWSNDVIDPIVETIDLQVFDRVAGAVDHEAVISGAATDFDRATPRRRRSSRREP